MNHLPAQSIERRLTVSFLLVIMFLMTPLRLWEALLSNVVATLQNFNLRDVVESSMLCRILQLIKEPDLRMNRFFEPNSLKTSEPYGSAFYRRLINEVARIHKTSPMRFDLLKITKVSRPSSTSERLEASQVLKTALSHRSLGQLSKSRKLLEHAFRLDPDNPEVLVSLGEAIEESWRQMRFINRRLVTSESHYPSNSLSTMPESLSIEEDKLILSAEHLYTRALIADPRLVQASQSKNRLMPLIEEIDQRRFNLIDFKVSRFYKIPENNPGLRQAKLEHYFKHIYHSNAIEGNTLTLAQTRSILETRLAVGGKSLLEQNEVLGLDAALRYINSSLLRSPSKSITLDTVLELHRHVLSFVDPSEAGHLRRTQVFIADHRPPSAEAVPQLMFELMAWLNSDQLSDVHPIELAALTHWKFVYIHPFYDGNGRTARLLMNLILMRAGLPPAIIKVEDRPAYYEHLKTANEGDVRPFIRFIATCTERTIDEYLEASLGKQKIFTEESSQIPPRQALTTDDEQETSVDLNGSLNKDGFDKCLNGISVHAGYPIPDTCQASSGKNQDVRITVIPTLPSVIYLGG